MRLTHIILDSLPYFYPFVSLLGTNCSPFCMRWNSMVQELSVVFQTANMQVLVLLMYLLLVP